MSQNKLALLLKPIVSSTIFNNAVLFTIIFSSALVGVSLNLPVESVWFPIVNGLETLILVFFSVEILMRIFAEEKPFDFFKDPWNTLDFIIVIICFIPIKDKAVYVLRLIRILRILRIFRAFPNLRPVFKGLVNSISSVIFVALLLGVMLYIYAVIGVSLFSVVDPPHFATLWKALFTLFQILTLENWNTIMLPVNSAYPIGGPLYFISFIILGTMIIMNLFVGIIVGNMAKAMDKLNAPAQMKEYLEDDASREKQIAVRLKRIENKLNKIVSKKKKKK